MDDLNRLLTDLQADDNLREWISKSANEAAADVVLADLGYNVSVAELRGFLEIEELKIDDFSNSTNRELREFNQPTRLRH